MTTFLSEPLVWHILVGVIGIGVAIWRLRQRDRALDARDPIIVDGWVTRWADDPAAYAAEHRIVRKKERDAILLVLFNVALQLLVWIAR